MSSLPLSSMWFSPPSADHFPKRKPAWFSSSTRVAPGIQDQPFAIPKVAILILMEKAMTPIYDENSRGMFVPDSQANFCSFVGDLPVCSRNISMHDQNETHML